MVGFVERTGRDHGVEHPIQMTVATSDGQSIWAFRYSSERDSRSLFFSTRMHVAAALEAREPTATIFSRYTIANRRFVSLIGAALALTFLVTELQPLQRIFSTVSLTSSQWGVCLLGPLVLLALAELGKLLDRARQGSAPQGAELQPDAG